MREATGRAVPQQARPVTLFSGQWADLPFTEVCRLASEWCYDGLEIACWGDHFDVVRAAEDDSYVTERRDILASYGLGCWAISHHLNGQAVCEAIIDDRYRQMVHPRVWGDGDPEGVRRRAAEEMKTTARAASASTPWSGSPAPRSGTTSPCSARRRRGHCRRLRRLRRPLEPDHRRLRRGRVCFAHEVHPSEIAYDYWSIVKTLEAIACRPGFGLNFDPSHMVWQGRDDVGFLDDFADRIYHVDCKDTEVRVHNDRNGRLGSHLPWADPRHGWDFIFTGRGATRWEDVFRMFNHIGYTGAVSIEWEDAGMDRLDGAPEALAFVRARNAVTPSAAAFDAAFATPD